MIPKNNDNNGITLNSYIARAGICSRRKAIELIQNGAIKINGIIVTQPAYRVLPADIVIYQGKQLEAEQKVYILLNKPKGYISTVSDEKGRKTILDLVAHMSTDRLYPVGRLDRATTGLIILTNDGEFAQQLAHPKYQVSKIYHAVLDHPITQEHFAALEKGITLEDGFICPKRIECIDGEGYVIKIEIASGRNRIIRRMFDFLGYTVAKLDRVQYAFLSKKNLMQGQARLLDPEEIKRLCRGVLSR